MSDNGIKTMKEIIIGRKGNQSFAITERTVSGKHLKATLLTDGNIEIEDLDSTNGTFVHGKRIVKKIVSPNQIVMLGNTYQIRIGDVFELVHKEPETPPAEEATEFAKLQKVYEDYEAAKIKLQQENAKKQFLRSLPGVASTVLFALTFLLGDSVNSIKPFMGLIMIAGIAASTWMAFKGQQIMPVKMEELNKKFMIDYVCPKCRNFLGFLPYENLKNRGVCSYCKTKW